MENNPLNRYAQKMADLYIERSPVSTMVTLFFMKDPESVATDNTHYGDDSDIRDLYHDFVDQDSGHPGHAVNIAVDKDGIPLILRKKAIVKKEHPLHYVQFDDTETLIDDTQDQPWTVSITMTDLPRIPRTDDMVFIENSLYTISEVLPSNRKLDSIVNLKIYPEHSLTPDDMFKKDQPFKIIKAKPLGQSGNYWFDITVIGTKSITEIGAPQGSLPQPKPEATKGLFYIPFDSNPIKVVPRNFLSTLDASAKTWIWIYMRTRDSEDEPWIYAVYNVYSDKPYPYPSEP